VPDDDLTEAVEAAVAPALEQQTVAGRLRLANFLFGPYAAQRHDSHTECTAETCAYIEWEEKF
jgi:hypothetical protein